MPRIYAPSVRAAIARALGTAPDRVVAIQHGMPLSTVAHWRRRAGIAPYRFKSRVPVGQRGVPAYLALLAQHPEGLRACHVAMALRISREAVRTMLPRLAARGLVVAHHDHRPGHGGRGVMWSLPPTHHKEAHAL